MLDRRLWKRINGETKILRNFLAKTILRNSLAKTVMCCQNALMQTTIIGGVGRLGDVDQLYSGWGYPRKGASVHRNGR